MVPLYGAIVWCHRMVPLYGAIVWCHCIVPLYGGIVWWHWIDLIHRNRAIVGKRDGSNKIVPLASDVCQQWIQWHQLVIAASNQGLIFEYLGWGCKRRL